MTKKPRKIKLKDQIQCVKTSKWFKISKIEENFIECYGFGQPHSFFMQEFLTEAEVRDLWRTPAALAAYFVKKYALKIDVASSAENKVCDLYYDEKSNGLISAWDENAWCNPPYSNIIPWCEKALASPHITVLLLPMRTASPWFRLLTGDPRVSWHAFKGRVKFEPPRGVEESSPRHDSGLFIVHEKENAANGFSGILHPKTGERV